VPDSKSSKVYKTKSSIAKSAKHGGSKASGPKSDSPPKAPKNPMPKATPAKSSLEAAKVFKTKSSKAKSGKGAKTLQANVFELEELNKAMGEEMAKSNEVIAEMIELLTEEDDESDTSEVVAPEPVTASIVSSYNTVNGSSSQAAWSTVALVIAMTGVLFF